MLNFNNVKIVNYEEYFRNYLITAIICVIAIILSVFIFKRIVKKIDSEVSKKDCTKGFFLFLLGLCMFIGGIVMLTSYEGPYMDVYVEVNPTEELTLSNLKEQKEYFKKIDGKIYFVNTINKLITTSSKRVQDQEYILENTREKFDEIADQYWFDSRLEK